MSYEAAEKAKHEEVGQKPRVWGIVILGFIRGVLSFFISINTLNEIQDLERLGAEFPPLLTPIIYLVLGLAVLVFVSSILLAMYKRWGLYAGIVSYGGDLALGGIMLLMFGSLGGGVLGFVIDAIVLRYLYQWLTQHPQTTYFD